MDLQSFGGPGISKTLMVSAHCFLPMSPLSVKETWVPVKFSGLALYFCKLHCLLFLLSLCLLQKHSANSLPNWMVALPFSFNDGSVSKGDGQAVENNSILEERLHLGKKI